MKRLISWLMAVCMMMTLVTAAADDDVVVENIHLSDSLMRLCYKISAKEGEKQ